jgi:carbon starvation protein
VSGFHCLVSSGTSSKQIRSEPDARFIGYGSMLTEGFLAVLVILACAAGLGLGVTAADGGMLTGEAAWLSRYSSWGAAEGLGAKVGAFVDGAANLLHALGLPLQAGVALMGVLVASFAATTLDTACRLQRYVVQELAGTTSDSPVLAPLRNKHGATIFAVIIATVIAMWPLAGQTFTWTSAGRGGLLLWPLFGATNQLLGGLAFLVISFYLYRRGIPVWFCAIPMIFMLIMPLWAMSVQLFVGTASTPGWLAQKNWLLVGIGVTSLALEIWMMVEAVMLIPKVKGLVEDPAPLPAHARP